jgi:hypothetical protein
MKRGRPARLGKTVTQNPRTHELLHHLATRPGHDEVKSDFRQLLVEEFDAELGHSISSAAFLKLEDASTP